jgi:hypothetical protein
MGSVEEIEAGIFGYDEGILAFFGRSLQRSMAALCCAAIPGGR